MSLKKSIIELSEKILPGLAKQRQRREEDEQRLKRFAEQKRKFEAGEEIEPLWVAFPNAQPNGWSQGYQEAWKSDVWMPFWNKLSNEERREYLERWNPSEDWYESLASGERGSIPNGEIEWFKEQEEKLEAGGEIKPPWFAFPVSYASFGWNTGRTEQWKLEIWIPFWNKLNQTDKERYLDKWQPPNEDWLKLITIDWTSKLKKANYWYNNQKENYQWNNYVQIPWSAFPNNPTVYEWEEGEREKWLINIWLPFWNGMSEESQDEYLKYKNPPDTEWLEILEKHKVRNLNKLKQILRAIVEDFGLVESKAEVERRECHNEQINKVKSVKEIEPPWIVFPNVEPWWGGWRQGGGEDWLLDVWLPFWQGLSKKQQKNYLERLPPPTEDWREYLTVHWVEDKSK